MHIHVCICNEIKLVNDSSQGVQESRSMWVGKARTLHASDEASPQG